MARRKIIVSSSGGIAAGSPFTLLHVLAVQQASPPVVFTQRLAFVLNPEESITAYGVASGVGSLVLGRDVVDAANGVNAILIGDDLSTNSGGGAGQADNQILIGSQINLPTAATASQNLVVIGTAVTMTPTLGNNGFGGSVVIGVNTIMNCGPVSAALNNVVIGASAKMTGSAGVVIGASAQGSPDQGVTIGQSAVGGVSSVTLGYNAHGGSGSANGIAIGANSNSGETGVAIGFGATNAGAVNGIVIGNAATVGGGGPTDSCAIGTAATCSGVSNLCVIGGPLAAGHGYSTVSIGHGLNAAMGNVTVTLQTTGLFGGAGNDLPGFGLRVVAGNGTGAWPNAENLGLDFQVGWVQGAGSTRQPNTSVLALRHSDLNVAMWGGLGATFGGGIRVLFLGNAVTVPTVAPVGGALFYVDPASGFVHILSANGVDTVIAL